MLKYFGMLQVARASNTPPPPPLRVLVHGGPGTGKSYLAKKIDEEAQKIGITTLGVAPTGVAAGNMSTQFRAGRTCAEALCIYDRTKEADDSAGNRVADRALPDATTAQLAKMLATVDIKTLGLIIIDEVSYVGSTMFGHIDQRLRELLGNDLPFGGVAVMLMGDFFQLPPVCDTALYSSAVDMFLRAEHPPGAASTSAPPSERSTYLFETFSLWELWINERAKDDPAHAELLDLIRMAKPGSACEIAARIARIRTLTAADVRADGSWATTPVAVTSNPESQALAPVLSKAFARLHRRPRLTWRIPLGGKTAAALSASQTAYLYKQYGGALTGYFVAGHNAYITDNINPSRRLANGTAVVLHSVELDEREDAVRVADACAAAQEAGGDVELRYPPRHINVELPKEYAGLLGRRTLVPGGRVIPVGLPRFPDIHKLAVRPGGKKFKFVVKPHSIQLACGITVHKFQGRTCDKVVFDVNLRPGRMMSLGFHGLYVGLSRVRKQSDLRFMPLQPGCFSLWHLERLGPSAELVSWLAGFGPTAPGGRRWQRGLAAAALAASAGTPADPFLEPVADQCG